MAIRAPDGANKREKEKLTILFDTGRSKVAVTIQPNTILLLEYRFIFTGLYEDNSLGISVPTSIRFQRFFYHINGQMSKLL